MPPQSPVVRVPGGYAGGTVEPARGRCLYRVKVEPRGTGERGEDLGGNTQRLKRFFPHGEQAGDIRKSFPDAVLSQGADARDEGQLNGISDR